MNTSCTCSSAPFPLCTRSTEVRAKELRGFRSVVKLWGYCSASATYSPRTMDQKIVDRHEETPESRLPPSIVGSIAIPIGIIWFAWSNSPSVHWLVSIVAQVPFGFGFVLVYISVQEYLVDAYTLYAASVLAANTIFRSAFGAVFPLFTNVRNWISLLSMP